MPRNDGCGKSFARRRGASIVCTTAPSVLRGQRRAGQSALFVAFIFRRTTTYDRPFQNLPVLDTALCRLPTAAKYRSLAESSLTIVDLGKRAAAEERHGNGPHGAWAGRSGNRTAVDCSSVATGASEFSTSRAACPLPASTASRPTLGKLPSRPTARLTPFAAALMERSSSITWTICQSEQGWFRVLKSCVCRHSLPQGTRKSRHLP